MDAVAKAKAAMERQKSGKKSSTSSSSVDDSAPVKEWSPLQRQLFVGLILVCLAVPTLFGLYTFLFPNYPARLSLSDAANLQRVFFGGDPALILCENATTLEAAGPALVALAGKLGVPSYRLDCTATLPGSERNTFERLSLERWNPTAFLVANGRVQRPQLPPYFTDASKRESLAKGLSLRVKAKHTRVDNSQDLTQCIQDSSDGCVLVYNSKPKEESAAELAPLVAAHRAQTFATLNAGVRAFRAPSAPQVEEFLMKEVSLAKASLGEGGGKGTVLISLRRIPEALAGGGSANVLVTLQAASGARVGEGDAAALLARQKAATDLLRALSETTAAKLRDAKPEDAAEVSIDAAFEREEKLGALGSALVATGDLVIDRAAVKQAPKASAAAAEEEEEGGGGEEAAQPQQTPEEAAAAERARESERRRRMAEEEASSPHLAQLVDEEEEGAAAAGEADDDAGADSADLADEDAKDL
jgi:hypothetical protein